MDGGADDTAANAGGADDGAAATRPYHHGDLPSALLEAVAALIREQGLEAVTLRAAARRAGVSHAAPAHHFGDKQGMLAAFADQGFERFAAALTTARASGGGSPAETLTAMGRAYLHFAADHRPWFEVMFRPELVGEHGPELAGHGGEAFQALLDQVTDCLAPTTSDSDVLGLALSVWAATHGLAHLLLDGPLEHMQLGPTTTLTDAVMTNVVQGLRAHPAWIGDEPGSAGDTADSDSDSDSDGDRGDRGSGGGTGDPRSALP